jgi:ferredoxin like protein
LEKLEDKLFTVRNKKDEGHPHIRVLDHTICGEKCEGKYCNHFCPAGVYLWEPKTAKTLVSYENCIECGACAIGCPFSNIECESPRGGFGVQFKFG